MAGRPQRRAKLAAAGQSVPARTGYLFREHGMAPGLTGIGTGVVKGYKIEGRANLVTVDLSGADLRGAFLFGSDFMEGEFNKTDFRGANLGGAHFRAAGLGGADFRGANLSRADFYEADLHGAKFDEGTNLSGVSWHGVNLDPKKDKHIIDLIERSFRSTLANLRDPDGDDEFEAEEYED